MNFQIPEEKKEKVAKIIGKALSDASFKERLLSNPKEAIQEFDPSFLGGGDTKIVVSDQTDEQVYLNVSPVTYVLLGGDLEELELAEEELEMVAGGYPTIMSCKMFSCW